MTELLRRKAWQLKDLERNPVCLGVPVGQDGGEQRGVSVDIGLKTHATISVSDLADASPSFQQQLYERAAAARGGTRRVPHADLLRRAQPVPMAVTVKEDMMQLPIASAVHPAALERSIPSEKLKLLNDKFFTEAPPPPGLTDLVVGGVPGADRHAAVRDEHRREVRANDQAAQAAARGQSDSA